MRKLKQNKGGDRTTERRKLRIQKEIVQCKRGRKKTSAKISSLRNSKFDWKTLKREVTDKRIKDIVHEYN